MEQPNSALHYLQVLPSTRQEIENFSGQILSKIENGEIDPLALKCQLKFIEKTIDKISEGIKDSVSKEASKYGKSFEYRGWRVEEAEAGVRYLFESDKIWKELKEKISEREKFLKSIIKPVADIDTGEIINPIQKKSTSVLKFTLI